MVVKISKFFAYSFFFLLVLMYLTPKVNLYYLLETKLKEKSVIVDNEGLSDNGFTLSINHASINVKSIESAKVQKIDVKVFGIYNSVSLSNITLASVAASMLPTNIQTLHISYSIFDPLHINASAVGDFGDATLNFNPLDGALYIELNPSKKMNSSYRQTLRNLKKSKEGVYTYDKTFKF